MATALETLVAMVMVSMLIASISTVQAGELCPKDCFCLAWTVRCSGKNLTEFPRAGVDADNDTIHFELDNNTIERLSIPKTDYPELEIINLHGNKIKTIDSDVFFNRDKLTEVDLSGNDLTSLPDGLFHFAGHLEKVNISHNHITRLEKNTFPPELMYLEVLDLSHNHIEYIDKYAMSDLKRLLTLRLHHNDLVSIHEWEFSGLDNLQVLDIRDNKLRELNEIIFQDFPYLKELYIDNNMITDFKADPVHLSRVKKITISGNQLKSVPNAALIDLPLLTYLDLSDNPIEALDDDSLTLPKLKTLVMTNMVKLASISASAFRKLTKLETLVLSNCPRIRSLPSLVFTFTTALTTVDLSGNSLETLDNDLLVWSNKINLTSNSWRCDCKLKWMHHENFVLQQKLTCASPASLRGQYIALVEPTLFVCPKRDDTHIFLVHVTRIVLVLVAVGVTGALAVLLFHRYKRRIPCLYRRPQKYVSLYDISNDPHNDLGGGNVVVKYKDGLVTARGPVRIDESAKSPVHL